MTEQQTTSLEHLRVRETDLTAEEQRLLDALRHVQASLAETRSAIAAEHLAAGDRTRRGERPRARRGRRPDVAVEEQRRVARGMGTFTVSEFAARLGCTKQTAKRHIDVMLTAEPALLRPAGKALGKPLYEYVKPTDAGAAFTAQQKLGRVHELFPDPHVPARDNPAEVRQSRIESVPDKEVRKAVREALDAGWQLVHTGGGGHSLRLVKGDRSLTVPTSPRNSQDSASMLRKQVRGGSSRELLQGGSRTGR